MDSSAQYIYDQLREIQEEKGDRKDYPAPLLVMRTGHHIVLNKIIRLGSPQPDEGKSGIMRCEGLVLLDEGMGDPVQQYREKCTFLLKLTEIAFIVMPTRK